MVRAHSDGSSTTFAGVGVLAFLVLIGTTVAFPLAADAAPYSKPVQTTIGIPLPTVRDASVNFEFHPSAKQAEVRIVGVGNETWAEACAESPEGPLGLWGHFWSGCIPIPQGGTLLPADDGFQHVGVMVRVVSSAPLKDAEIRISYLPGDFHFYLAAVVPTPPVAKFTARTASPVRLGAGIGATCSGTFTVLASKHVIVRRTLRVPSAGTWVNEFRRTSSSYMVSLADPHCEQPGVDVGLGIDTGSPGGP
jgi:hypothetical protein